MSGATSYIRTAELLSRLKEVPDPVGVEIGIFVGSMSHDILKGHPTLFLYMVDSWAEGDKQPERYKVVKDYHAHMTLEAQDANWREAIHVTEFAKDRRKVIRETSVDAAKQFEDKSLDFVFIDADHSYEGCLEDIETWKSKVKPGGILSGHDYGYDQPSSHGVKIAVHEAVDKYGWKLELGPDYTWFVRMNGS